MCAEKEREGERDLSSSSHKDIIHYSHQHGDPTFMTSYDLIYLQKAPPPNVIVLGVRASAYGFRESTNYPVHSNT